MPAIFSTKYHEVWMPDYDKIQQEVVDGITTAAALNSNPDHPYARGGSVIMTQGFNGFDLNSIPNGSKILEFVESQLTEYWNYLGYKKNCKPYLLNIWASHNPKGGSWTSHNHAPSTLAGCFYVDASPEKGNIVFEHPLELVLGYQPYPGDLIDVTLGHEVDADSGKLLLFPGYLKHKVGVNTTDSPRIIIGFDINYRSA
jgi:hypothetical protein